MSSRTLAGQVTQSVKRLLDELDVSGSELARRLRVSQPYIWRRLSGEVEFSFSDLEQIAAALEVPIDRVLPTKAAA